MSGTEIDLKQALQIARTFNLAFNNAFMFGGDHQTTKDSSANFFIMLEQAFDIVGIITVSVERGSVYLENHCVDKLVSVARIASRFTKAGLQSVSFDKDAALEDVQALFFMIGSLADFKDVATMQQYLVNNSIAGVRLNYVQYQKVTVDEAIVNRDLLSETQMLNNLPAKGKGDYGQPDPVDLRSGLAEILSLGSGAHENQPSGSDAAGAAGASSAEYDRFIATQIKSISHQLDASARPDDAPPPCLRQKCLNQSTG